MRSLSASGHPHSDCNLSEAGLYFSSQICTVPMAGAYHAEVEGSTLEFPRGKMVPKGDKILFCAGTL